MKRRIRHAFCTGQAAIEMIKAQSFTQATANQAASKGTIGAMETGTATLRI